VVKKQFDLARRVEESIRGALEAGGFELVHVEYRPPGAGSVLRVYIDKAGGVSVEDCRRASRQVSVYLDVDDLIPHRYTLEVSSPGIERPLFKKSDFERFAGEQIRLFTKKKIGDRGKLKGLLKGVIDDALEITYQGETLKIPLNWVKKANLVVNFD
jgi:ribosome maturation factor RimP